MSESSGLISKPPPVEGECPWWSEAPGDALGPIFTAERQRCAESNDIDEATVNETRRGRNDDLSHHDAGGPLAYLANLCGFAGGHEPSCVASWHGEQQAA